MVASVLASVMRSRLGARAGLPVDLADSPASPQVSAGSAAADAESRVERMFEARVCQERRPRVRSGAAESRCRRGAARRRWCRGAASGPGRAGLVGSGHDHCPAAARSAVELDLTADVVELTRVLCDVESVSGNEGPLADAVEAALRRLPHLEVLRDGDAVVARTELGRPSGSCSPATSTPCRRRRTCRAPERRRRRGTLVGRGTADMKGGVAVQLRSPPRCRARPGDVTFVFYDHEEVDAASNGLGRLVARAPGLDRRRPRGPPRADGGAASRAAATARCGRR